MNITCFIIGLWIGAPLGYLAAALMFAAKDQTARRSSGNDKSGVLDKSNCRELLGK
jgi:hypothetical protein